MLNSWKNAISGQKRDVLHAESASTIEKCVCVCVL